jgi:4-nitrophenyl phosphatase
LIEVVCDLDGVIYRGSRVLDGVPGAMSRLEAAGGRLLFVTNNSTRTPGEVAIRIESMTGLACHPSNVCTSPEAAVGMLFAEDAPTFVVGEIGITEVLTEAGWQVTTDSSEAGSVMVGLTPQMDYQWLAAASDAIRKGARFIATNVDPTYPTEDGLLPGAGSIVAAIAVAAGREPEVAGKPHQPMVDLVRSRLGAGPVWVVGDRVDTDMAMAAGEPDWRSVLVMGGVTESGVEGIDADYVVSGFPEAIELILGHS